MPRAGFAQQLQVDRVIHAHAAGALHQRFENHRRSLLRVAFERFFHIAEAASRVVLPGFAGRAVKTIGRLDHYWLHQQRRIGIAIHAFAADAERAERFTVIAITETDEFRFRRLAGVAPVMRTHFQADLDRAAAVVGIEAAREPLRCHRAELLRQPHHRLVREAAEHDVIERVELEFQRRDDMRMPMPEQVRPPGTDRIEITLALEVGQPRAFGFLDRHERQPLVILHLCARVPDVRERARCEFSVLHQDECAYL